MKRKIFIALTISQNLKKNIGKWMKDHQNFQVNWVADKNLHITLVPPFYEDEKKIEDIKAKLKKFRNFLGSEIRLDFKNIDFGFDNKSPRLIWITGETPEKIKKLRLNLEDVFNQRSGYWDFFMHITIARFNAEKFYDFPIKKLNEKITWEGAADALVLMESRTSRVGVDYDILERVKL